MNFGLLWYDKDSRIPFAQKVMEAGERYREKFGVAPNTCYVHPDTLPEGITAPGFELRTRATIRPHHFWVGVADDAQPAPVVEPTPDLAIVEVVPPRRRRRAA